VVNESLDALISERFPDVCVDKRAAREVGIGERAIPAFVADWLVSRYSQTGVLDKERIQDFLANHLPDKQQVNLLRNRLLEGEQVTILDAYSVEVDLQRGRRVLKIPSLDIFDAFVADEIVESNNLLLVGSVWGGGRLVCRRAPDVPERRQIWMDDFRPMQTSVVDIDYFIDQRNAFSLQQWRELLIQSMGYNSASYTGQQQTWMLARLTALVQPRLNIVELAPKGTGKSYVFSQLSKYAWLISGGIVTRAQLFYNMATKMPGVITRYDAVILDEVQTIRLSDEGQVLGALKGFLEAGEFRVMGYQGNSEAGFGLLANIPIGADGRPQRRNYFELLPAWLHGPESTALLDRLHGLIPGWDLPRIRKDCLATGMGLRADYLSEILHALRLRGEYMDYVKQHTRTSGDLRDIRAVQRLAAGLLRLFFPDLDTVNPRLFAQHCLEPAKQLRQGVRYQLAEMDEEYKPELAHIEAV